MEHGVAVNDANGMGMTTVLHIIVGLGTTGAATGCSSAGALIGAIMNSTRRRSRGLPRRPREMLELLLSRGALRELPDDEPWSRCRPRGRDAAAMYTFSECFDLQARAGRRGQWGSSHPLPNER